MSAGNHTAIGFILKNLRLGQKVTIVAAGGFKFTGRFHGMQGGTVLLVNQRSRALWFRWDRIDGILL